VVRLLRSWTGWHAADVRKVMLALLSNPPATESMGAVQLKGLEEPVPLVKVVVGKAAVVSGAAES